MTGRRRPVQRGVGRSLPTPEPGRRAAESFVAEHLHHLVDRRSIHLPSSSSVFRGGQREADVALDRFEIAGYEAAKDLAYPQRRRSVSSLSPWVRHGLLDLPRLWDHVEGGPEADVRAFRAELLWQEYARHRYARVRQPRPDVVTRGSGPGRGWDRRMGCVEIALEELEEDGWLVDQARRWLANHWTVARGEDPARGEEHFHRHLLDGSRAANGLGWAGAELYPFTRWEVEERAAGLCASCDLVGSCPIERERERPTRLVDATLPSTGPSSPLEADSDLATTVGPQIPVVDRDGPGPDHVWLTAESMGDADPALAANPELPAVFVFDEPLLKRLRLSSKRLVFITENLSDLATRRPVEIRLGDPVAVLAGRRLAATFTPVPGWRARARALRLVSVHPWPWLRQPHAGDLSTFAAWRNGL